LPVFAYHHHGCNIRPAGKRKAIWTTEFNSPVTDTFPYYHSFPPAYLLRTSSWEYQYFIVVAQLIRIAFTATKEGMGYRINSCADNFDKTAFSYSVAIADDAEAFYGRRFLHCGYRSWFSDPFPLCRIRCKQSFA
jgi:hypothetical protein